MATSAAKRLLGRGVHWADYLIDGRPVLLAITSSGDCVKRVRLARDEDEELATEWLLGLIEHYDPRPHLTLIRPSEGTPRDLFLSLLRRRP